MSSLQSADQAIRHTFSAMRNPPTLIGDVSVTTSSATLFDDAPITDGAPCRSVTIQNTAASGGATLGITFIAAGATASGISLSSCFRLEPKAIAEVLIGCNIRVVAVSSSGTITANVLVLDQGQQV